MKRYLVYITIAAVIGIMASPAMAGKPTRGGTSSIALAGAAEARTSPATLGSLVGFDTTVEALAGWEWPMVAVLCYQDLNGDGVQRFPNDEGDLVYAQLDHPDAAFLLGGGSSRWKTLGGAADCDAVLYAYGNKAKNQTIRELARTSFSAGA
jgi:hypothetical protein